MARFNDETPDDPAVRYLSYGAEFEPGWSNAFWMSWKVINEREGAVAFAHEVGGELIALCRGERWTGFDRVGEVGRVPNDTDERQSSVRRSSALLGSALTQCGLAEISLAGLGSAFFSLFVGCGTR